MRKIRKTGTAKHFFLFLKSGKSWNLEYIETMSMMRNLGKIL